MVYEHGRDSRDLEGKLCEPIRFGDFTMVVDIFCKIKGFDSESTDETHQQWIKALSYNYGLSQLISRVGA
jgi:hypothetical protein